MGKIVMVGALSQDMLVLWLVLSETVLTQYWVWSEKYGESKWTALADGMNTIKIPGDVVSGYNLATSRWINFGELIYNIVMITVKNTVLYILKFAKKLYLNYCMLTHVIK